MKPYYEMNPQSDTTSTEIPSTTSQTISPSSADDATCSMTGDSKLSPNWHESISQRLYEHAGIRPYFCDPNTVIIHADCRDVLPMLEPVELVLTDPPYSATTHEGARTNVCGAARGGGVTAIDFASTDADFIREVLSQCCPRRWCISFIDWKHALPLAEIPPEGLRFVRLGAWVKLNPMPQITGDRPSTGWESVVIFHPPGRMRWNGGSGPAVWMHGTTRYGYFGPSNHPTEKPIGLVRKILEQFSDPGETILDPFMGSGTTLRAAKDLGRKAIGIEIEERYCEIAAKRLQQAVLPLEMAAV